MTIDPAVDQLKDATYKVQSLADDIARAAGEIRMSVDMIVDRAVNEGRELGEGVAVRFPPIEAAAGALEDAGISNLQTILDVMHMMARDIKP